MQNIYLHFATCAGIQQLLASLEKISPKLEGREDDIQFLKDMLEMEEFHSVMKVLTTYAALHCIAAIFVYIIITTTR